MRTVVVALCILSGLSSDVVARSFRQCHPLLQGRVVNTDGAPIPDATISVKEDLSSPDRERPTTRPDGTYRLDSVAVKCPMPTSITVRVSANGYEPAAATRQAEEGVFRFEHILDRVQR